jgi:hypothetical protein
VLAVIELKQVLKIVEDLADYIALGVTGEIEKRQWSGYWQNRVIDFRNKSFRYSLRLRIAVVDGMRNMYYDYAHKKAEVVVELRQELFSINLRYLCNNNSDSFWKKCVALKRTVLEALRIFSVYSYIMKAKVQQRCLNKKSTLVDNERRSKRACEQIVQLHYSLEATTKQRKIRTSHSDIHCRCDRWNWETSMVRVLTE